MRASLLVALGCCALAVACLAGPRTATETHSTSERLQQPQNIPATRLWADNCANCHGESGKGGGAGTGTLLTVELTRQDLDRKFFDSIKNGVPDTGMTEFGSTMSDAQIWSLVVHTRELQARALPPKLTDFDDVNATKRAKFTVEQVLGGAQLRTPWAVDWLPDGRMLVTNRPGTLLVAQSGKVVTEVAGLPESVEMGQGGLMEVAVHPDYAKNGWVYIAYNKGGGNGAMTCVARGKLKFEGVKATWTSEQTVWAPAERDFVRSGVHFGCRIVFDKKGRIFFTTGERGTGERAQDLSRPNGKTHRVNEDGTIPSDNPFAGRDDALASVWSFGHRNSQGLVLGLDGTLWDTEHGPRGGDELNKVQRAANYGWPKHSFGINYNDAPYATPWVADGMTMPVYRWLPSVGACGLDVVRGPGFGAWKGDLLAGGLSGQCVDRVRVTDGKFVEVERIFSGNGRVRDVAYGPDGAIYIVLNEPDIVVRLIEVK